MRHHHVIGLIFALPAAWGWTCATEKVLDPTPCLGKGAGSLPQLLIAGYPKAGSTSAFYTLVDSGLAFSPVHEEGEPQQMLKELLYFDRFYELGDDWYASHFPSCSDPRARNLITMVRLLYAPFFLLGICSPIS